MKHDLPCLPPVAHPKRPAIPAPPGACDTHFHLFGPSARFPFAEERSYTPQDAPLEKLLALQDTLGLSRGVVVQGNAHGTDPSVLLDALTREPERLRGTAIVRETVATAELKRMADLGVRALRIHHIAAADKATFSPLGIETFLSLAPRMADLGLHLQAMLTASELPRVMPRLGDWKLPVVIDHYGLVPAAEGLDGAGFQALRRYLAEGRIWVKLSAAYRVSQRYPDYDDLAPLHAALVAANPDQVLWGSDWPHPRLERDMPDDGVLLDLFNRWTPDAALRRKILVDNPARLYGFA